MVSLEQASRICRGKGWGRQTTFSQVYTNTYTLKLSGEQKLVRENGELKKRRTVCVIKVYLHTKGSKQEKHLIYYTTGISRRENRKKHYGEQRNEQETKG